MRRSIVIALLNVVLTAYTMEPPPSVILDVRALRSTFEHNLQRNCILLAAELDKEKLASPTLDQALGHLNRSALARLEQPYFTMTPFEVRLKCSDAQTVAKSFPVDYYNKLIPACMYRTSLSFAACVSELEKCVLSKLKELNAATLDKEHEQIKTFLHSRLPPVVAAYVLRRVGAQAVRPLAEPCCLATLTRLHTHASQAYIQSDGFLVTNAGLSYKKAERWSAAAPTPDVVFDYGKRPEKAKECVHRILSSDARYILCGLSDGSVELFGKDQEPVLLRPIGSSADVLKFVFLPDPLITGLAIGSTAVAAGYSDRSIPHPKQKVYIWDLKTKKVITEIDPLGQHYTDKSNTTAARFHLVFTPNRLVIGISSLIKKYTTGLYTQEQDLDVGSTITALALCSAKNYGAVTTTARDIVVWNIARLQIQRKINEKHSSGPWSALGFSHDGTCLAAGNVSPQGQAEVWLYNLDTFVCYKKFRELAAQVNHISFSPDDAQLCLTDTAGFTTLISYEPTLEQTMCACAFENACVKSPSALAAALVCAHPFFEKLPQAVQERIKHKIGDLPYIARITKPSV